MRSLILSLGFLSFSLPVLSAPITFTGAELANLSGASFPTSGQSIVGDGLRFDPTIFGAVLYRLDLDNFVIDPTDISFSLAFKRLPNDLGEPDQDIFVGIYDGLNVFNTVVDGRPNEQFRLIHRIDGLNVTETQLGSSFFDQAGPVIALPIIPLFELNVTIRATPTNTTLISDVNGSGGISSTVSNLLGTSAGLSLLIIGNEINENHLISSLTFNTGIGLPTTLPEPGPLIGLALGLGVLGFSFYRRRFV